MHESQKADEKEWSHEDASKLLIEHLWKTVRAENSGLTKYDLELIKEAIDPPKTEIEAAMAKGSLKSEWPSLLSGRPYNKAWMYEIVSSRRGFDLDRLDYFLRDPQSFGLVSGIESEIPRILGSMRLVSYDYCAVQRTTSGKKCEVTTVAFLSKVKDTLRRNFFEHRANLHRTLYQHRVSKKVEMHMVKIMGDLTSNMVYRGLTMTQCANLDPNRFNPKAYAKLTDALVFTWLSNPPPKLKSNEDYDEVRRKHRRAA